MGTETAAPGAVGVPARYIPGIVLGLLVALEV